ncbi:MAG: hypothetical protein HRT58_04470 [Crocinitomicaceae bacterium]|nr:hypothetical protein [Flavobacteriales bacterium]NQZ34891.1 hypothetical protein [Crocinitomicaceae bacterium]
MKKVIGHSNSKGENWLFSKRIDLIVLFVPVWIIWTLFLSNQDYYESAEIPAWLWLVVILGIDVSHVWSSLFRTYWYKDEFETHKRRLIAIPIILFILSCLVLLYSPAWFWTIMAYLAVFHFIKQQYGFLALYNYRAGCRRKKLVSDKLIIYIATLYPIIYWHFNSQSEFNWFVENDFLALGQYIKDSSIVTEVFYYLSWLYWGIIGYWTFDEIRGKVKGEPFSYGKVLWTLTTALNWWFGIVYFNSDLVFSVSNVVAHGIPYVALIYFYDVKKASIKSGLNPKITFLVKRLLIILGVIVIAALVEEYFWDMLVYNEHSSIFERIFPYNWEQLTSSWGLAIAVAVLALPQQVHYVIDGFIWKMNDKNKYLKPIFSRKHES